MADLIAQGPTSADRWRREIPDAASGIEITLGRSEGDWNVQWDGLVSRKHVRIVPMPDNRIEVIQLPSARNPIFHRGQKTTRMIVVPGDHFVIGKTTFTLAIRPGASDAVRASDITSHAFDHNALRRRNFSDAGSRIEMLSRLPDLIASSDSDQELLVRVTNVMLQATPDASAVAVVALEAGQSDVESTVSVLHFDSRVSVGDAPTISAGLVREANRRRESVLHLWSGHQENDSNFTASEDVDWSFCVPLRSEACPGWAIYVTGQLAVQPGHDFGQSIQTAPEDLHDDVKFAELVGTTIGNLRQSRRLQRRQAAMRHFFAPVVMNALAQRDTDDVLEPREADLSVMFCDLRGFSRRSEEGADQLLKLLSQVSDALGVMTRHIIELGGVIGGLSR